MKISGGMVSHYLNAVTAYVGDIGDAAEDVSEYHEDIINMKLRAEKHGDLDSLRLAIDYLLTHPEANPSSYAAIHYDYDDEEIKELLNYIRLVVWSTESVTNLEEVNKVELVNTSLSDWWEMRKNKEIS
ncbi:MAG: hypothetical protein ACFBSE_18470 [Prochloraceae cyanobacterium]